MLKLHRNHIYLAPLYVPSAYAVPGARRLLGTQLWIGVASVATEGSCMFLQPCPGGHMFLSLCHPGLSPLQTVLIPLEVWRP